MEQRWKANISACPIQAMADLFLRYLRFLLFNPKPMNQQEEYLQRRRCSQLR